MKKKKKKEKENRERVAVSFRKRRDRTFRKVFPFIGDGGGFRIRKRGGNLERVRIEARNIRPSLKRRLEQRGGVSRLNHSSAHRPPFPLS